jgi:hypothetical protein
MDQAQLEQLLNFFGEQLATNPGIARTAKLHSIMPPIELERAELLSRVKPEDISISVLTDKLPFRLKRPVWYVAYFVPSQAYAAVIVPYHDTFLWLDNHFDDTDFELLLASEKIPLDYPGEVAAFLLETKFRYLTLGFQAKVVSVKSDIPLWPELLSEDNVSLQEYLEEEKAALDLIGQIIVPPSFEMHSDVTHLVFFIWTAVFGSVYKLNCSFGTHGSFTWSGERIAINIGKSFAPR